MAADNKELELAGWLDLKALSNYASASEKTLRGWIHAITDPLPASQRGNKLYVRRGRFDEWMERQQIKKSVDINAMVEDIVNSVRA